jgi:hypothetical protein
MHLEDILMYVKYKNIFLVANRCILTPKGLRVFLLKTASKQPLLKASWIEQN